MNRKIFLDIEKRIHLPGSPPPLSHLQTLCTQLILACLETMQGLIDEQKNLIDMSSASLLLNTDVKTTETAILQDLRLHSLTTDLFLESVEWPHKDLHLTKVSTSVSSSGVNMAEATPVTEESTMNRNSSHQIASDLQVAEFIWKQMAVLPMVI